MKAAPRHLLLTLFTINIVHMSALDIDPGVLSLTKRCKYSRWKVLLRKRWNSWVQLKGKGSAIAEVDKVNCS
jgi:acyl-CoA-binding protein